MKSIEWMPFLGDRFWESEAVAAMDDSGVALYVWLLWRQFKNESLPGPDVLKTLPHRWQGKRWDRVWPQVCPCFDVGDDGRLRNRVCSEEREAMLKRVDSARLNGKLGGRPPKPTNNPPVISGEPPGSIPLTQVKAPTGPDRIFSSPTESAEGEPPPAAEDPPKPKRAERTGPQAELVAHWRAEWARTRSGTRCAPPVKADWVVLAWMLTETDIANAKRRMTAILEDSDEWVHKRASIKLLRAQWDNYALAAAKPVKVQEPADAAEIRALWARKRVRKIPNPTGMPGTVEVVEPFPGYDAAKLALNGVTA